MRICSLWTICLVVLSTNTVFSQKAPSNDAFASYTGCTLHDGPAIVETAPLAPGITARTVMTLKGPYTVPMLEGRRLMFAYPDEDFYANVKVEILPKDGYADSKKALTGEFEKILAADDNSRNYKLKPQLNGFDIQGLDRSKREGGVLGIYLLFDDPTRTVMTIYFLNQEPPKRFRTMEEYGAVRDHFLAEYTTCIRSGIRKTSNQ
jgi:hypothetical protein